MNTTGYDAFGGGMALIHDSTFIANCIVWGNSAQRGPQIGVCDSRVSISYCDVQDGMDSISVDTLSTVHWGPGNIDVDPRFETGPLGDYHLSYGSPCIDAGNPAPEYYDPEDPLNPDYALWPAMGTVINDQDAYGGGSVGYWLSAQGGETPEGPVLQLQSHPNPFRGSCMVYFRLERAASGSLELYDLSGRLVRTLMSGRLPRGGCSAVLDGSDLSSGVYVIRLRAGNTCSSRRCVRLR